MVPDLAGVVEDHLLVGLAGGRHDDLLERLALEFRAQDQLVEVVHVELVVPAPVDADRLGPDHGGERVLGVWQLHVGNGFSAEHDRRRAQGSERGAGSGGLEEITTGDA
jgi:hypothetical protein